MEKERGSFQDRSLSHRTGKKRNKVFSPIGFSYGFSTKKKKTRKKRRPVSFFPKKERFSTKGQIFSTENQSKRNPFTHREKGEGACPGEGRRAFPPFQQPLLLRRLKNIYLSYPISFLSLYRACARKVKMKVLKVSRKLFFISLFLNLYNTSERHGFKT